MKIDRSSTADYLVYLPCNSSSAETGPPLSSAVPESLGSLMKNNIVFYDQIIDTFNEQPDDLAKTLPIPKQTLDSKNHTP